MSERGGRLEGKRAMVTGAGSGIGRAVALRYAREGARVGLLERRADAVAETVSLIEGTGGECIPLPCDVSSEAQVAGSLDTIVKEWGGLDIVAGVAGIELAGTGDARVDELELSIWERTIGTNLTGMFLTCKYGVRGLLSSGGGAVIVTGSPCGILGHCAAEHAYSASKAGTHGLVRVMAADYASRNIRVNCVIPGLHRHAAQRGCDCRRRNAGGCQSRHPREASGQSRRGRGAVRVACFRRSLVRDRRVLHGRRRADGSLVS